MILKNKKIFKTVVSSLIVITTIGSHHIYAENIYSVAIKNDVVTREWAGKDGTVRNTFPKDTVFNVHDAYGDYVFVTKEVEYGWVDKDDIVARDERGNQVAYGRVTVSTLNIRDIPSLDGNVVKQLELNDNVMITNISQDFQWFYIKNDIGEGWVFSSYIKVDDQIRSANIIYNKPVSDDQLLSNDYVEVSRSAERDPNFEAPSYEEETVELYDYKEGSYYIKGEDGQFKWVSSEDVTIQAINEDEKNDKAEDLINIGKSLLGIPYVWGAVGPNAFDCSGFTKYVYGQVGISLSRTSRSQSVEGQWVSPSDIKEGDLIFFDTSGAINNSITHVGIYIGNNQFIHASSSSSGKYVRISNLYSEYYGRRIVTIRRIF